MESIEGETNDYFAENYDTAAVLEVRWCIMQCISILPVLPVGHFKVSYIEGTKLQCRIWPNARGICTDF